MFWAQVEGRLMAMLENEAELTLTTLNTATIAWVEMEYHRKNHSEIAAVPLTRYLNGKNVGRDCPELATLKRAFCNEVKRKQRHSDGTFTLEGVRFEIPAHYRHRDTITVRYARWDLSAAFLIDPHTNTFLSTLYPQDKSENASGLRRSLEENKIPHDATPPSGTAPLLKQLMAEYAATGLPPAYIPTREKTNQEED